MKKSFARDAAMQRKSAMLSKSKMAPVESEMGDEDSASIDRILMKRKGYSEGGVVANETTSTADESPNEFDDLVLDDNLEAHYAEDFNEHGNEALDKREEDDISRIMRQRKMRQRNPSPA